jgi:hypothetical protein
VSAAIEVDFVSHVEAQSDRSNLTLKSAAWIDGAHYIFVVKILHVADKSPKRSWRRIEHGIHKSTLDGHQGMKIGVPQSQFWAKKSVEQAVV